MKRPLKNIRPAGPFVQSHGPQKTVLLTCDFSPTQREDQLRQIVENAGSKISRGEIAELRIEENAVSNSDKGVRVVYDTNVNAIDKGDIDQFESTIENNLIASDLRTKLQEIVVVAEQ